MKKNLFVIVYLLSPFLIILPNMWQNPEKFSNPSVCLSMIFGACAYTWINWQMVIAAKPKFLTRNFQMKWIHMFHGIMSIMAVALSALHTEIVEDAFGSGAIEDFGEIALGVFVFITVISVIFMPTIGQKIGVVKGFRKLLNKLPFYKYKYIKWSHNIVIVGVILLMIHVLMTGTVQANPLVFGIYVTYFLIGMSFYAGSKLKSFNVAYAKKKEIVEIR